MSDRPDRSDELHRRLTRRLVDDGNAFRLASVADELGIDHTTARELAESVFARFYQQVVNDGVITRKERRELKLLRQRLEISAACRRRVYKQRMAEAKADGKITREERNDLRNLKRALGFERSKSRQKSPTQECKSADEKRPTKSAPRFQTEDQKERAAVFDQLRRSPEYLGRSSEERLAGLPRREPLLRLGFVYGYIAVCVLLTVPLTFAWGGFAADTSMLPFLFGLSMKAGGFGLLGVGIFGTSAALVAYWRGGSGIVDRADVTSRPVIVTGKREKKFGDSYLYFASFVDQEGAHFEQELWSKRLAEQFYTGDAGIVFLWQGRVIAFDRVLESQAILESHVQGAYECPHCESVYRMGQVPADCTNCGVDLREYLSRGLRVKRQFVSAIFVAFDRWADNHSIRTGSLRDVENPTLKDRFGQQVTCGWCHTPFAQRPTTPNCPSCGGVLPLPASDPGAEPPPPPRTLPSGFKHDLFYGKQPMLKVCLIFLVASIVLMFPFGPFILPFLAIGVLGTLDSLIAARRRWLAYSRGVPVLGKIDRIQVLDDEVYMGNKTYDRYRVYFRFKADGQPVRGMTSSFDSAISAHYLGQQVWVVYVPGKPHLCALWPPLA